MMKQGDILYFKAAEDWQFYFEILGFNKKSIKISKALEKPTEPKTTHIISKIKGFGTCTPSFKISDIWYQARMQKRCQDLDTIDNELEFDPAKQIAIVWSIDDVKSIRPDLDEEQAIEVLLLVKDKHDTDMGITWTSLKITANELFPE